MPEKKDIIKLIEASGLTGRGGGGYPTAKKWQSVRRAAGKEKMVVANGSEGEPGILKDRYILEKYPEALVAGLQLAVEYLDADLAYIYLNPSYARIFTKKLMPLMRGKRMVIFEKGHDAGYIGGEETSALNHIEGRRVEPRLRPPFPTEHGLWGRPTLVGNLETFYDVSLISSGRYAGKRLFTIGGDIRHKGVFELPENMAIEKVLKTTGNAPDFPFFVQIGGDASGVVLNSEQLGSPACGGASITVYSQLKHNPLDLMRSWASFFAAESCGQCAPCREGTSRLKRILDASHPDWTAAVEIMETLSDTSFCGLGCSAPVPIRTFAKNVLTRDEAYRSFAESAENRPICDCR